jgi:hypothetical protein
MRALGTRAALALTLALAGCAAVAPAGTPSPTVTPAPVPTTATPAGSSPPASAAFDPETTYPIGPIEPTCPAGPGDEEDRYPAIRSRTVIVNGTWSDGNDAAVLAERAALGTDLDPRAPLFPAAESHEQVRLAGETFDPRERFDTDGFALVGAVETPAFHAIVLAPEDDRTPVVLYYVTGVC